MPEEKDSLLRVSFLVSEHEDDIQGVKERIQDLYETVNVGSNSLVVKVSLTEAELSRLVMLISNTEKFLSEIEVVKLQNKGRIWDRVLIVLGVMATAILSNLDKIKDFILELLY